MMLFAAIPNPQAAGQIVLAILLAAAGFFLMLPKPRGRSVAGGTAALLAATAVVAAWLHQSFGEPMPDLIGTILFWLFSAGAVGFGTVLVVQRNPARGAIAFAFVILSTCGLFLLLAAPFLMAATIIIYAGAIIVTFLFVLMLSQATGPSNENDRTREPLLGSLAGFAFVGLVLFTLQQTQASVDPVPRTDSAGHPKMSAPFPAPVLTPAERKSLADAVERLRPLEDDDFYSSPLIGMTGLERTDRVIGVQRLIEDVVGVSKEESMIHDGSIRGRLGGYRSDPQAKAVLERAAAVRDLSVTTFRKVENAIASPSSRKDIVGAKEAVRKLQEEVRLLHGVGDLPARNVGNIGLLLYADHLLAVELAGTLLLVATIGAVAIAHRKGVSP